MRQLLLSFFSRFYPALIFIFLYLFIFRAVFLKHLFPYPGDLLVSFFFPYNGGGWAGISAFGTHKEFIASDVIRQIYPWRRLAMDLLKQGVLPLWNPYAFSGTPLLANLQSAVFYPLNIFFFFFPAKTAWLSYVLVQPILAFSFMYLYIRGLRLHKAAAAFAGLAFAFIGYFLVWLELGVIGHTGLWLPLVLWGILRFSETKKTIYLLIATLGISFSLLAGHAQTAIYLIIISYAYFFFVTWKKFSITSLLFPLFLLVLPFGLAALQLFPSWELLQFSARNAATAAAVFHRFQLAPQYLIMILAPDFFGNPATGNFWGNDYGELFSYFGVVTVTLSAVGLYLRWSVKTVRFFFIAALIALLFALPTPFSELLFTLHVPVLGTGVPARSVYLVATGFVILAAYGAHVVLTKKANIFLPLAVVALCYLTLWGVIFLTPVLFRGTPLWLHLAVAKRNLILPTGVFIGSIFLLVFSRYFYRYRVGLFLLLIFLAGFEYSYVFNKYSPESPGNFFFPEHPLISALQKRAGFDRVIGYDAARISTNFPTEWRLYSPEGYDPLYSKQYGELINAANHQHFDTDVARSDAGFQTSVPVNDTYAQQVAMNLLGVLYIADRADTRNADTAKYSPDRFSLIWQQNTWKIYENKQALPRAGVFYQWEVQENPASLVNRLFSDDFAYRNTLLLSENPEVSQHRSSPMTPALIKSSFGNSVQITANAKYPGLVFLSDSYIPGWKAYVDGKETKLYEVDYALRAVPVSQGVHEITMRYEPDSFRIGLIISITSGLIFLFFVVMSFPKVSFRKYAKS